MSNPVYPGAQPKKKQQRKKKQKDDEPEHRLYKKTTNERGMKFLKKEKTGKPKAKGKKKGKR
jgi:hypothetical protein